MDKDLINLIKATERMIAEAIPAVREEVDFIINNQVDSIEEIERLLDTLLDYAHVNQGTEEFKRLNAYYATIHQENSETYTRFYNEIFED